MTAPRPLSARLSCEAKKNDKPVKTIKAKRLAEKAAANANTGPS